MQRGAIEGQERCVGVAAEIVQGTRHKLLAGPGFAQDQDRDVGVGEVEDVATQRLDRFGSSEQDPVEPGEPEKPRLEAGVAFFHP